ncbi:MAG: DNA-directed RNA polymerase subunit omega [Candidatus Acidiferrales bacterium]
MTVHNTPPESRFAFVVVASRRARQLMLGAGPLIANPHSLKNTRVAMEELQNSVLEFDIPLYTKPVDPTKRGKG